LAAIHSSRPAGIRIAPHSHTRATVLPSDSFTSANSTRKLNSNIAANAVPAWIVGSSSRKCRLIDRRYNERSANTVTTVGAKKHTIQDGGNW